MTGVRDRALQQLDTSIEQQKQTNDFLEGVPGIVEAIRAGKIECRVYNKKKFHAKAYITHSRLAVVKYPRIGNHQRRIGKFVEGDANSLIGGFLRNSIEH